MTHYEVGYRDKEARMNRKIISYLSYGSLIVGTLIGAYAFIDIYLVKSRLPSNVCPVTGNRPLLYTAIAFCCISFILSFFEKKDNKEEKP